MNITVTTRPFIFTVGTLTFPLSAEETQQLIDNNIVVRATANRVVVDGRMNGRAVITPATLGGGPAFLITK